MAINIEGRINFDKTSVDEATESVQELNNALEKTEEAGKTSSQSIADNVKKLKNTLDIVGGSVQTLVGGLNLLGVENEYVKNIEQGALNAIAFGNGLKQLGDGLSKVLKNTEAATDATKKATIANRVFNAVAKANPYILAATAIVGVVGAFIALSQAFKETALEAALANQSASDLADTLTADADAAERLNLSVEDVAKVYEQAAIEAEKQLEATKGSEESLKLQGKSEREILVIKQEQTNEIIAARKQALEALIEQNKLEVEKTERFANATKVILQFLTAPVQLLLGAVDGIIEGLGAVGVLSEETVSNVGSLREQFNDFGTSLIFDPKKTKAEGDAVVEEAEKTIEALKNQRDGFQNRINAIDKGAADKRKAERDKEAEEERKRLEELQKNEEKIREFLNKSRLDRELDRKTAVERELAELELEFAEQIKLAGNNLELREQLEREYANRRAEIEQRNNDEIKAKVAETAETVRVLNLTDRQRQIEEINAYYDQLEQDAAGNAEVLQQIAIARGTALSAKQKEFNDQDVEATRQTEALKVEAIQNGFAAISGLLNSFAGQSESQQRKLFNAQKALAIAETTIQTYAAAQGAYQSQLSIPSPDAPIRATLAAAAAVASGLARVAAIRRQKFTPQSSSGGGSPSGGISAGATSNQPATPQFNLFAQDTNNVVGPGANQNQNQNGNPFEPNFNTTLRAVVVESDITSTRNRLDLIQNGAEL